MKTTPVEHDRMFKSYTADAQTHVADNDRWEESNRSISNSDRWEESDYTTPNPGEGKTDSRHIVSDCKPDYH